MLSIEYNYELNLEARYEEGIEKGAEEQARTTAIRMHQKGMDIANIADCVQFDIETVKGWLANYDYELDMKTQCEEAIDHFSKLINMLSKQKRYADIEKVTEDAAYRDKLMKEYKLI